MYSIRDTIFKLRSAQICQTLKQTHNGRREPGAENGKIMVELHTLCCTRNIHARNTGLLNRLGQLIRRVIACVAD